MHYDSSYTTSNAWSPSEGACRVSVYITGRRYTRTGRISRRWGAVARFVLCNEHGTQSFFCVLTRAYLKGKRTRGLAKKVYDATRKSLLGIEDYEYSLGVHHPHGVILRTFGPLDPLHERFEDTLLENYAVDDGFKGRRSTKR